MSCQAWFIMFVVCQAISVQSLSACLAYAGSWSMAKVTGDQRQFALFYEWNGEPGLVFMCQHHMFYTFTPYYNSP